MPIDSRRAFLKTAAAGAALTQTTPAIVSGRNLNDSIRVAVVGFGGRAAAHAASIVELQGDAGIGVRLAGVCDCDATKVAGSAAAWSDRAGHTVAGYDDMRRVLDDRDIDAVTFATPNHWHALGTIWACQAGKDVYVEKPGSHNVVEGRRMVEAARKYGRVVQHGTQCRSSPNIVEGIQKLHHGVIGKVYCARGIAFKIRGNLGRHEPIPVPAGLDWDAWCGPAPVRPYSTFNRHRWHWIWDYGGGEISNQGVHQLDLIRWGLKLDTHPRSVAAMGTTFMQERVHRSSAETPGLLSALLKWPDGTLVEFEVRDWLTNAEAGFRDTYPFVQKDFPVGVVFLGTEGTMIFPDYSSYHTFLGSKRTPGPSARAEGSPMPDTPHFRNWLEAIRLRDPTRLTADILEGHMSSSLCHLANVAYRVDHTIRFDHDTEKCLDDAAADTLLSRPSREPYAMPETL